MTTQLPQHEMAALRRGEEPGVPTLSIVIVSYNTRELLQACLRSVQASVLDYAYEVFVVDNGSRDGSLAMVAAEFPEVVRLVETGDRGYAAANNLALRRGSGAYRLLLNPDTELPRDALATMLAFMDSHPRVGIAGPKLVKRNGRLDLACRRSFPHADQRPLSLPPPAPTVPGESHLRRVQSHLPRSQPVL